MSDEKDELCVGPVCGHGERLAYRRRDGEIETGVVRELEDGRPLPEGAELVQMNIPPGCDGECGGWHSATTVYRNGPAQVATPKYREGYDRVFSKQKVGLA
jgi:hypothetical protein